MWHGFIPRSNVKLWARALPAPQIAKGRRGTAALGTRPPRAPRVAHTRWSACLRPARAPFSAALYPMRRRTTTWYLSAFPVSEQVQARARVAGSDMWQRWSFPPVEPTRPRFGLSPALGRPALSTRTACPMRAPSVCLGQPSARRLMRARCTAQRGACVLPR